MERIRSTEYFCPQANVETESCILLLSTSIPLQYSSTRLKVFGNMSHTPIAMRTMGKLKFGGEGDLNAFLEWVGGETNQGFPHTCTSPRGLYSSHSFHFQYVVLKVQSLIRSGSLHYCSDPILRSFQLLQFYRYE